MAGSSVAPIALSKRVCLNCVIAYELTASQAGRGGPFTFRTSMVVVNGKTYAIGDDGPYDESELREKIHAYCDEHGFHAALTLTVNEVGEDGTAGRPVDPGKFLG
jgi:hypothetical protein